VRLLEKAMNLRCDVVWRCGPLSYLPPINFHFWMRVACPSPRPSYWWTMDFLWLGRAHLARAIHHPPFTLCSYFVWVPLPLSPSWSLDNDQGSFLSRGSLPLDQPRLSSRGPCAPLFLVCVCVWMLMFKRMTWALSPLIEGWFEWKGEGEGGRGGGGRLGASRAPQTRWSPQNSSWMLFQVRRCRRRPRPPIPGSSFQRFSSPSPQLDVRCLPHFPFHSLLE